MALLFLSMGWTMPMYRGTFFFKNGTGYGWTETIFSNKTTILDAQTSAIDLARRRIQMLGTDAFLTFVRISDDLIKRDSFVWQNPAGSQATSVHNARPSDIPNTALICRMEAGAQHRRTLYIRGQEDDCCSNGGVYTPTPNFVDAFDTWANIILTDGWSIRTKNTLVLPVHIQTATQTVPDGIVTVTTLEDHGMSVRDTVLIRGCAGATALNGEWAVLTTPSSKTFTVRIGQIMTAYFGGGTALAQAFVLIAINNLFIRGVSHRITGRPFDLHRGRRPARA